LHQGIEIVARDRSGGYSKADVAPEIRTGALFSYAAFAMVMSILACCGVR
jgi:hypothetical protein